MAARLFVFAFFLAAGGALGWRVEGQAGAAAGVALGALLWFLLETSRAARVLRWLRSPEPRELPRLGGLWGQVADRVRRIVVAGDRRAADAQDRLDTFLDAIRNSPNGVVLLDPQGRIEWINETAAAHYGLDPERDLQQHIVNLVRDPDFAALFARRGDPQDLVIPAPGSTAARPVKLALRLHPFGEGRVMLLSRDVTAMEQAEIMRRDFVANVSHEIRTPLTVLAGFVETLQHLDVEAEERARYLGLMARQTRRMQTLVDDLLTLSRLEGSPLPSAGEWTPVALLLAQSEQEARALAAAQGKRLELRFLPAPAVSLGGAAGELQSAVSNLVSNAVRYTPSGGSIEVAVREVPGGLELAVHDTGPGIAAEHLPRLTERFYRVDRSRSRETGGTGLGLAIVKHVVQRHGGELRIESTPGRGSTFTIALPAARVRPQVAGAPAAAAVAESRT
jgi:two-component system, OmpR family, phosphate regulon sensor histidine kinase PhoR